MTEDGQRKPFAAFVNEQRGGALHGELSEGLTDLVRAVHDTGKPGTIALTIKVTPNKDGATVQVTDKVKVSLPEGDRGAAIFFFDEHGNLSRRDPRQIELPLQDVSAPPGDVKHPEGAAVTA